MKIVHVTLSAGGGAGRACARLDRALREVGVESTIVTAADGTRPALTALWQRLAVHLDRAPLLRYRRRAVFAWWSNNRIGWFPTRAVAAATADVVHLHWIGDGMISPDRLPSLGTRVVWTLHDMWAFSGGCHYADGCGRYETGCGACPQLGSSRERDLSSRNVQRKAVAWRDHPWVAICPSQWLTECARRSRLLGSRRIECIRNAVPFDVFEHKERGEARARFGIAPGDLVLVAGADGGQADRRKGLQMLRAAVTELPRRFPGRTVRCVLFGQGKAEVGRSGDVIIQTVGPVHDDDQLAWLYGAADVVVVPSLQDNLPNVAVEAVACGAPVVGFASGGLPEIVATPACGAIAAEFTAGALAEAISGTLEFRVRTPSAPRDCRDIAFDSYEPGRIARLHAELYAGLVDGGVQRRNASPHP